MYPKKASNWLYPSKVQIGSYPTPLERHYNLSKDLGVNFYIKHEQAADPIGGIKIRPIEYLIKRALDHELAGFVMDAVLHSNSATALAYHAKSFGLQLELLVRDHKPELLTGNHKIMCESGARVSYIPDKNWEAARLLKEKIRIESVLNNQPLMVVPPGASDKLTVWGTIDLAYEIGNFEKQNSINFDQIVLAVGSGGTYSGLEIGRRLQGKPWKITAIRIEDCGLPVDANDLVMNYYQQKFNDLAINVVEQLKISEDIFSEPLNFYHAAIGEGYAKFSPEDLIEVKRIKDKYDIYFCPTYVYKAFRGVRELIELSEIGQGSNVLFIHTGGMLEPCEPDDNWGI